MTAIVRPANPHDLTLLEEIENSADSLLISYLQPDQWRLAPDLQARASMAGFILIVAPDEVSHAVGFAQVLESAGIAHLEQLSVLPEFGRRGLGRALVMAAMSEAAMRGYDSITLRTFATVPWNGPFYESCGFSESQPDTPFHKTLESAESRGQSDRYGRRIQMTARLQPQV